MNVSSRTLTFATLFLVVVLLGGGVYWRLRPADEGNGEGEERAEVPPPGSATASFPTDIAIPVEGVPARRDTLVIAVASAGQAEAWQRVTIRAQVPGRVMSIPVRENHPVQPGATLLQIDTVEYALAVAKARSDVRRAEADFLQRTLFDEEIQDPEIREERRRMARSTSGLEQAEVALRQAELNLARTRVEAPFRGRVANLEVVEGQHVETGAELVTVVDLDPIKVEVQVLEGDIGLLEEGRQASVTFPGLPGETFQGRIQTMNPVVDPETRTARVTVVLPNPRGRILPGMYARVSLDALHFADRLIVPRDAILERDRRTMLFVYEEEGPRGRAKWRYVTTGLENDSLVEIVPSEETDTVAPGEIVLVGGHATLVHDAVVRLAGDARREGGRPR